MMTISAASGANNSHPGLTAGTVSGDYSLSRTTIVCGTLSQALEISLSGPSPNLGVTYPVSPEGSDAGEESERLIPFVSAYVDDVDLGERLITVDWGLDF